MVNREYDWASLKAGQRGHNAGDHSNCDPNRCIPAERLWIAHDQHLRSIALLAELDAQGVDPASVLGDELEATMADARAEFPEFVYLVPEPDFVHTLQARTRIKDLYMAGVR